MKGFWFVAVIVMFCLTIVNGNYYGAIGVLGLGFLGYGMSYFTLSATNQAMAAKIMQLTNKLEEKEKQTIDTTFSKKEVDDLKADNHKLFTKLKEAQAAAAAAGASANTSVEAGELQKELDAAKRREQKAEWLRLEQEKIIVQLQETLQNVMAQKATIHMNVADVVESIKIDDTIEITPIEDEVTVEKAITVVEEEAAYKPSEAVNQVPDSYGYVEMNTSSSSYNPQS